MKHHKLKTHSESFKELWSGFKTFEIRVNDRDFKKGDMVTLYEWNPGELPIDSPDYDGRCMDFVIGYITQGEWGLPREICVFQIHSIGLLEARDWHKKARKAKKEGKS